MQAEHTTPAPDGASENLRDLPDLIGAMETAFWRWYVTGAFGEDMEVKGPLSEEYDRLERMFVNYRCLDPAEMWIKARYVVERPHLNESVDYLVPILRGLTGQKGGAE